MGNNRKIILLHVVYQFLTHRQREIEAEGRFTVDNLLNVTLTKIQKYAPISLEEFKTLPAVNPPAPLAVNSQAIPAAPAVNPPARSVANPVVDRSAHSQPATATQSPASRPQSYIKVPQTASIILQAAIANDYPEKFNSIVPSQCSSR